MTFGVVFKKNLHCFCLKYRLRDSRPSAMTRRLSVVYWKYRAAATLWPLFCLSVLTKVFHKLLWW